MLLEKNRGSIRSPGCPSIRTSRIRVTWFPSPSRGSLLEENKYISKNTVKNWYVTSNLQTFILSLSLSLSKTYVQMSVYGVLLMVIGGFIPIASAYSPTNDHTFSVDMTVKVTRINNISSWTICTRRGHTTVKCRWFFGKYFRIWKPNRYASFNSWYTLRFVITSHVWFYLTCENVLSGITQNCS